MEQRNKSTSLRRLPIREYLLSRCKPGVSNIDFVDVVGPFMTNKIKSQWNIILKEDKCIVTEPSHVCEIFTTLFSTNADSIAEHDEINMENEYFLYVFGKHKNHNSILKIKEHHGDVPSFDFKPVTAVCVEKLLKMLKINKATGYNHMPAKMVKMYSNELLVTLMELLTYAFTHKRFPGEMKKSWDSPFI